MSALRTSDAIERMAYALMAAAQRSCVQGGMDVLLCMNDYWMDGARAAVDELERMLVSPHKAELGIPDYAEQVQELHDSGRFDLMAEWYLLQKEKREGDAAKASRK